MVEKYTKLGHNEAIEVVIMKPAQPIEKNQPDEKLVKLLHYNNFRKKAGSLSKQLQKEIKILKKQFCGGLFHAFTIQTKRKKLEALQELLQAGSFDELAASSESYHQQWRVMLGKKSRVKNLIEAIISIKEDLVNPQQKMK
jgi:hypothetical protein